MDPLGAVRPALSDFRVWVVGGAVRDRRLGRRFDDVDLAVDGDPRAAARALADRIDGAPFPLSEAFGAWRVVATGRGWHADLAALRGATIEEDLARRDFTINAMAEPLAGGRPLDPFDGASDLAAGRLRMVAAAAFDDDPLRVMRLVRLACELEATPEPATRAAAARRAGAVGGVAPERVFDELKRIVSADAALTGVELMRELGLLAVVLPELDALRGVEQSAYHHLDVYGHTLAVLAEAIELERDPRSGLGADRGSVVDVILRGPLADELTRWQGLRFAALLHDAAKPATRGIRSDGRVTFLGHDREGAELARTVLGRLRASERTRAFVSAITREHLRLGFLVHERPLSARAVFRYLRACEPVELEVTVFTAADRLATRGRRAERAIAAHLELVREMLDAALAWRAQGAPAQLVRGDDLAAAIGLEPGPRLGELLEELAEAAYAGEVASREEAIAWARARAS